MWRCCALLLSLVGAPAFAAELADAPLSSAAGPFGGRGPVETIEDEIKEKKSEKELQAEERLAALEAAQSQKIARVVALQWPETDTDYKTDGLQRNVKVRIARPDAKFYPEIDLYQAGRKEPDRSVRPIDQRAMVPEDAAARVMAAVDEISSVPWNALSEQDWGLKAHELRELAKEIWFVDRVELREPLFLLYTQIGRAADASGTGTPPFYEAIGEQAVNYYWYLAGSMAHDEPALMSKLTERDLNASIGFYKDQLEQGGFPIMTLGFELNSKWDPKAFAGEYQLFINGLEVLITDPKGLHRVPPGRVDVYMSRGDGHSLSDRIELEKLDDKIYFVREVARKKMGLDFIDQLMEHPYECTPPVDGDILNYLSIYAKLHAGSEIYIVVPKGGSVAPSKIFLWRWDRPSGTLQKVLDDTGGFPVRFVSLVGTGITFSGVETATKSVEPPEPSTNGGAPPSAKDAPISATPTPSAVPIMYHMRGHYGRLMMTFGLEFSANISGGGPWKDLYQTNSNKPFKCDGDAGCEALNDGAHQVTQDVTVDQNGSPPTGETRVSDTTTTSTVLVRERIWQRLVFTGIGVVLGRNAAIGFGPRGYLRTGWYNAPHAVDMTGHLGYAALAPFAKGHAGRVNPIIDMDFFGGIMLPFRDSLFIPGNDKAPLTKQAAEQKLGKTIPTFGATLAAGLTF